MSLFSSDDKLRREDLEFTTDASAGELMKAPSSSKALLWAVIAFFVGLILWAAFFSIDETVRGQGKAVPFSSVQVLQSFEGGIVEKIDVREGQAVSAGEPLLELDPTQANSSLQEIESQYHDMLARTLRLEAELEEKKLVFPPEVASKHKRLFHDQMMDFEVTRSEIEQQVKLTHLEIEKLERQKDSIRAQLKDSEAELAALQSQKEANEPLVASGAVAPAEMQKIEQQLASIRSNRDRLATSIPELDAQIASLDAQKDEIRLKRKREATETYSQARAKLEVLESTLDRMGEAVDRTSIESPVDGVIKRLYVSTLGGVVRPGEDIVEIVPIEDNVLIEAQISPKDIGFVVTGMPAKVRISAYDFAVYGGLEGIVDTVSADSIVDQRGRSYYIAKIRIEDASFERGGKTYRVIPGMQATVDITVARKSVLEYIFKPLLRVAQ